MKLIITHSMNHLNFCDDATMQFKKVDARTVALDLVNLPHEERELIASIGNQEIATHAVKSLISVAPVLSGLSLFARESINVEDNDKVYVFKKLEDGTNDWRLLNVNPVLELNKTAEKLKKVARSSKVLERPVVSANKETIADKRADSQTQTAAIKPQTEQHNPIWKNVVKYGAVVLIIGYILSLVKISPVSAGLAMTVLAMIGVRRLRKKPVSAPQPIIIK